MEIVNKRESCHVLLAEDNKINQKLMMLLLGKLEVDVVVANDGREAVEAAKTTPFDLILMDLHMPVMDGLEATQEIHALLDSTAPPVVALTAHAVDSSIQKAMAKGMAGYLTKPVNLEQLKDCLQEHTGISL
jgi:CheY-like chemotaxis protein